MTATSYLAMAATANAKSNQDGSVMVDQLLKGRYV